MAAQQNVVAALRGGPVALLAAMGALALCACTIALINRAEKPEVTADADPDAVAVAAAVAVADADSDAADRLDPKSTAQPA
jgi:cytochrome oxidase Cu insertion factor (SCO1/SenC/PrrC family)